MLARFVDPTPMNNPGQVEGNYGWDGDCLQFRTIVGAGVAGDAANGRGAHWTAWRGPGWKKVAFDMVSRYLLDLPWRLRSLHWRKFMPSPSNSLS